MFKFWSKKKTKKKKLKSIHKKYKLTKKEMWMWLPSHFANISPKDRKKLIW